VWIRRLSITNVQKDLALDADWGLRCRRHRLEPTNVQSLATSPPAAATLILYVHQIVP
jgi:hypothetical protein